MAPIKPYKPNDLNVNPFAVAQGIALPYDYDGTLKEMMNWQQLTNQEATTDFNQARAEEAKREQEFDDKRKAEIEKLMGEGGDPSEFKMSDVEKMIGNTEGYLKLKTEERKAAQDSQDRSLKIRSTINTVGKTNPIYAAQLAKEFGIGDFRAPIQKGDKGDKPSKPKLDEYTNGKDVIVIDTNNPEQVREAVKNKFFNLKDFDLARNLQLTSESEEETPKDTRSWWEQMNGDKPKIVGATPENPSSQSPNLKGLPKPPPGHLLVKNKKTGKIEIIKK